MQLRLTVVRETEGRTAIHVDGRLAHEGVTALVEACRTVPTGGLALDLTHLLTVDDAGLATLRRLAGEGALIRHASPYVALLLQGQSGDDAESGLGRDRRVPRGGGR